MLTVQSLVEDLGLSSIAGGSAIDSPVRWVHISELEDPTPFLSGGELMLTTGIPLDTPAKQRAYVKRLVRHNLAGIGFGTGFDHRKVPKALTQEAEKQGFPVFEVPYSVPFIALTERAFSRLINDQHEVLQRGIAVQRKLERLVLEERGLGEIAATVASAAGGIAIFLDPRGAVLARRGFRHQISDDEERAIGEQVAGHSKDGRPFVPSGELIEGRALAHPVISPGGGPPQAWVVIVRDTGGLGDYERLILQQTVAVVALELMRRRVVSETERRLAGDVLAGALSGKLDSVELRRRLEPFGIGDSAAVLVFAVEDPPAAVVVLERALTEVGCPALVATHKSRGRQLLCAVVDATGREPIEIARRVRESMIGELPGISASASRAAPPDALRRSFHEARCALEVVSFQNGSAPDVASWENLGAFTLLLSVQDDHALRFYHESVLGPIESGESEYGGELVRSLESFIEHNGQWERAAKDVYCHRHTLRYRMRRVEELTGRDLSRAHDRIEFWLALRARELVG